MALALAEMDPYLCGRPARPPQRPRQGQGHRGHGKLHQPDQPGGPGDPPNSTRPATGDRTSGLAYAQNTFTASAEFTAPASGETPARRLTPKKGGGSAGLPNERERFFSPGAQNASLLPAAAINARGTTAYPR